MRLERPQRMFVVDGETFGGLANERGRVFAAVVGEIVAGKDDEVRGECVNMIDTALQVGPPNKGAVVQIGELRDGQAIECGRQTGQGYVDVTDLDPVRFDQLHVGRPAEAERGRGPERAAQELATSQLHEGLDSFTTLLAQSVRYHAVNGTGSRFTSSPAFVVAADSRAAIAAEFASVASLLAGIEPARARRAPAESLVGGNVQGRTAN